MTINLATALGLASTLLAVSFTLPQLLKLVRTRTAAGVSLAAMTNSTISGVGWTTYGIVEGDVWVTLTAAVSLPGTIGVIVLGRHTGDRSRMWLPVVWLGVILAATAAVPTVGMVPITLVLGCSVALLVAPAAITAWRSADVSGIAAAGWAFLICDALVCGAYGVVADVPVNVIYAIVATLGATAILVRIGLPDHVHARLVPVPAGIDPNVVRDELSLAA